MRKRQKALHLDHLRGLVGRDGRALERKEEGRQELGHAFSTKGHPKHLHDGHGRRRCGSYDCVVDQRLAGEAVDVGLVRMGRHGVLEEQDSSKLTIAINATSSASPPRGPELQIGPCELVPGSINIATISIDSRM